MKMKFLTEPAMMIGNALVISDLHIGLEYEIYKSGITVPSQVSDLASETSSAASARARCFSCCGTTNV